MIDKVNFCSKISEHKIEYVVNSVLKYESKKFDDTRFKGANLNIILVDEDEIKALNAKFRNVNSSTDVLSFSYHDEDEFGDVIICPEVVRKNAEKFKVSFEEEFFRVLIHGILHLLGYDHEDEISEKEMFDEQEKLLKRIIIEERKDIL